MENLDLQVIATAVLACLWALSEGLSMIPQVKANGIFQAVWNGLKWVKEKGLVNLLPKK